MKESSYYRKATTVAVFLLTFGSGTVGVCLKDAQCPGDQVCLFKRFQDFKAGKVRIFFGIMYSILHNLLICKLAFGHFYICFTFYEFLTSVSELKILLDKWKGQIWVWNGSLIFYWVCYWIFLLQKGQRRDLWLSSQSYHLEVALFASFRKFWRFMFSQSSMSPRPLLWPFEQNLHVPFTPRKLPWNYHNFNHNNGGNCSHRSRNGIGSGSSQRNFENFNRRYEQNVSRNFEKSIGINYTSALWILDQGSSSHRCLHRFGIYCKSKTLQFFSYKTTIFFKNFSIFPLKSTIFP